MCITLILTFSMGAMRHTAHQCVLQVRSLHSTGHLMSILVKFFEFLVKISDANRLSNITSTTTYSSGSWEIYCVSIADEIVCGLNRAHQQVFRAKLCLFTLCREILPLSAVYVAVFMKTHKIKKSLWCAHK